jgi:hypothetical protein
MAQPRAEQRLRAAGSSDERGTLRAAEGPAGASALLEKLLAVGWLITHFLRPGLLSSLQLLFPFAFGLDLLSCSSS